MAVVERLVELAEDKIGPSRARRVLLEALAGGTVVVFGDAAHEIRGWSAPQIDAFKQELRRFLRGLVDTRAEPDDDRGALVPSVTLRRLDLAPAVGMSQIALTVDGDGRDVLWFQIVDLLRATGVNRLRACPGCVRLFVRTGRQEYCSDSCQARIYMRGRRRGGQDKARPLAVAHPETIVRAAIHSRLKLSSSS